MPGTDALRAAQISVGENEFSFLPELPGRGLGADMIGRAAALLVDMPMDYAASGYRLSARQSVMGRRSRDFLKADLDAFEEAWERAGLAGRSGSSRFRRAVRSRWPRRWNWRAGTRSCAIAAPGPTLSNRWPKDSGCTPTRFTNAPVHK